MLLVTSVLILRSAARAKVFLTTGPRRPSARALGLLRASLSLEGLKCGAHAFSIWRVVPISHEMLFRARDDLLFGIFGIERSNVAPKKGAEHFASVTDPPTTDCQAEEFSKGSIHSH
jgi:hypothetical protein